MSQDNIVETSFVDGWMWVDSKKFIIPIDAEVTFQIIELSGMITEQDIGEFKKNVGMMINGIVTTNLISTSKPDKLFHKVSCILEE